MKLLPAGHNQTVGQFFHLHAHAPQIFGYRADAVRFLDAQLARIAHRQAGFAGRAQHREHGNLVTGVGGIAEMCFLHFAAEHISREVARGCAAHGVLFKRTAYNFVSLAHDEGTVDQTLRILDEVLGADPSRLRRSG